MAGNTPPAFWHWERPKGPRRWTSRPYLRALGRVAEGKAGLGLKHPVGRSSSFRGEVLSLQLLSRIQQSTLRVPGLRDARGVLVPTSHLHLSPIFQPCSIAEGAADPLSPWASLFGTKWLMSPFDLDFPSLLPQLLGVPAQSSSPKSGLPSQLHPRNPAPSTTLHNCPPSPHSVALDTRISFE